MIYFPADTAEALRQNLLVFCIYFCWFLCFVIVISPSMNPIGVGRRMKSIKVTNKHTHRQNSPRQCFKTTIQRSESSRNHQRCLLSFVQVLGAQLRAYGQEDSRRRRSQATDNSATGFSYYTQLLGDAAMSVLKGIKKEKNERLLSSSIHVWRQRTGNVARVSFEQAS